MKYITKFEKHLQVVFIVHVTNRAFGNVALAKSIVIKTKERVLKYNLFSIHDVEKYSTSMSDGNCACY